MNKFNVGELVVLKTHPLLEDFRIKGDGKLVPPIMLIKEVFIESTKKVVFDDESGKKIADRVKYLCLYFNDSKSEFIETTIYQTMLETFRNLKIERISKKGDVYRGDKIIDEIEAYTIPKYEYGKIVRLKTKKIEIYKKRSTRKFTISTEKKDDLKVKEIIQYVVNYTSPDFIICGFRKNEIKNSHYPNGGSKRITCENLFKVKWFNSHQQKFSEQYLPESFLTDEMSFKEIDKIEAGKK